jgi:hypothetical protein
MAFQPGSPTVRLRISGHAARGDAMIASEDGCRHPFEVRHFTSLPARHPYRQLFKATEASWRFGELLLSFSGGCRSARAAGGQVATESESVNISWRDPVSPSCRFLRSTASRMPSPSARLSTSSPPRRARTRSNICESCSDHRARSRLFRAVRRSVPGSAERHRRGRLCARRTQVCAGGAATASGSPMATTG